MMLRAKILFLSIFFSSCFSFGMLSSYQYINENGLIHGLIVDTFKALDIELTANINQGQTLPANHIFNAYNFLKNFYHEDRDFYRKGGKSSYVLTKTQVQKILQLIRGSYALFTTQDPIEKKKADVIIFSGVGWSLEKRLHSFKKFLDDGYQCENVLFLSRTHELENCVKQAVNEHTTLFNGITIHLIQSPHPSCSHEDLIVQAAPSFSKEFYLISDPEYAHALKNACATYSIKHDLNFLGVFVRPITQNPDDYVAQELKAYKFDEYLSEADDQMLAAACSSLNILAHQVAEEIKQFAPNYNI